MPHPGHFICARDCQFFLNTYVGDFIVSTVGEYFPDAPVREIIAQHRNITLKGIGDERRFDYGKKIGFKEIGLDRKYETMVFRASRREDDNECCPYRVSDHTDLDFDGYNDPVSAYKGHMKMCEKWSRKCLCHADAEAKGVKIKGQCDHGNWE